MSDILKKSSKSIKEVNKRDDTAENKYFEENMSNDIFSLENIGVGVEDSEEKRIKRLEKIEKRLGRYDKAEKIKHKKNNILMKYFTGYWSLIKQVRDIK